MPADAVFPRPHSGARPEWTRWLNVLSDLHYDPARGIAPHKPLLLLVVCDLVEEGKLRGSLLARDGDLAFRFSSYWTIVADRRRTRPDPFLSFAHRRSRKVVRLLAGGATDIWVPLVEQGSTTPVLWSLSTSLHKFGDVFLLR